MINSNITTDILQKQSLDLSAKQALELNLSETVNPILNEDLLSYLHPFDQTKAVEAMQLYSLLVSKVTGIPDAEIFQSFFFLESFLLKLYAEDLKRLFNPSSLFFISSDINETFRIPLTLGYANIFISLIIAFLIAALIIILSYILVFQQSDSEKISAYECGFQPFEEARSQFDIRFYLVAILFIIFDLEIMFLFPWSVNLSILGFFGYWSMLFFLLILTIGFIYEWKKGALDWE